MASGLPPLTLTYGRGGRERSAGGSDPLPSRRERVGLLLAAAATDRLVAGHHAAITAGPWRSGRIGFLLAAATADGLVAGRRARPHARIAASTRIRQIGLLLTCLSSQLDPRTRFAGVVFEIVVWLGAAIAICAKGSSRNV